MYEAPAYANESPAAAREEILDREHLRLLRIGFFVSAGSTAILIPIGLVYAGMGAVLASTLGKLPVSSSSAGSPPPEFMGWIFGAFGLAFAIFGGVGAGLKLLAGIRLGQRRSRVLCMVVAGFTCMELPWGTLLGVFTFIVLSRPGVRQLFEQPA